MPLTGALVDDFGDNTVDAVRWPNCYDPGKYSEVGGRARVVCDAGYNAFASAATYTLTGSHVQARVYPPAAGGATTEAWAQLLVQTVTLGTDAIAEVNVATGNLVLASRVAYYDPAQVTIPYDPVAHAYVRIREAAGSLMWDTSPNGRTWTNRKTDVTPVWAADTTLQVQLIAHRSDGTNDFAEFGGFNVLVGALQLSLETDTARPLGQSKVRALGRPSETATAQPLGRVKRRTLGVATATETAQLIRRGGLRPTTLTDNFNDNTIDLAKWATNFGTVSEVGGRARVVTNTGYNAYASAKIYRLTGSSIACRAWPPAVGGATTEAWSQMLIKSIDGTDAGFELKATTNQLLCISRVGYTDGAGVALTYSATDHAWMRLRETAGSLIWETSPDGITWTTRRTQTTPAWTAGVDLGIQLISHRSNGTVDYAEFDDFNLLPPVPLGTAAETATAQALARTKRRALPTVSATETALLLGRSKRRTLTTAVTAEAAQVFGRRKTKALALAAETDTARPFGRVKSRPLGLALETATAVAFEATQAAVLPRAAETDTALALGRTKRRGLGTAGGVDTARPLTSRKTRVLGLATETAAARPLGTGKRRTLALSTETDTARPIPGSKRRTLAWAGEVATAQPFAGTSAGVLPRAASVETAQPFRAVKTLHLGVAVEMATARIGPVQRLGPALIVEEAMPLVGRRQRPADHLTPGTAGPRLTAGTRAPSLTTHVTTGG